jgi:type IV secretory pathway VirJ component
VSSTAVTFLGVIAASVLIMALIQVGAIVFAARLAKRVEALAGRLERDVQPAIERLTAMSGEASRAATLAASQVARVDRMLDDLTRRAEHTATQVQLAFTRPQREGAAVAAGVRGFVSSLRDQQRARRARAAGLDDDDALFIG